MAEKLDVFKFSAGGRPKYPYDEWMDGSIWKITKGVDYEVHTNSMEACIRDAAHRRGLGCRVSMTIEGCLVFQAVQVEEGEACPLHLQRRRVWPIGGAAGTG